MLVYSLENNWEQLKGAEMVEKWEKRMVWKWGRRRVLMKVEQMVRWKAGLMAEMKEIQKDRLWELHWEKV